MVFTDELKQLINADDTQKKVILSFPNSDIEDITNSQIYSESMSLEESLIEQSDIQFGKCNSSIFKIRVTNIDSELEGLDLSASITFTNSSLGLEESINIGEYVIKTAECTADRKWKDIVAYDYMTKFDVDIAEWYNTIAFPTEDTKVSCKTLISMLCEYIGVSYDTNYNFTFGDLEISKNILPTSLSGRDFLQQLLEFNCCFGHFNEEGVLLFIEIGYGDEIAIIDVYKTSDYEENKVLQPNGVSIKMEDDSIGVQAGAESSDRTYVVIGNSCLFGFDADTLQTIATTMLEKLSQFYYTPNVTEIKGGLYLGLGSSYEVNHKFGTFQSYVLKRTIKGIQALYSTLESNAVEYATETSNIINEMSVIKGKTAKIKRDIDSLTVEYQDFAEQTRTEFEQSAEKFSWLVADNFSESNVMLSAEAYTAIANNIVLQGNRIILDGDTTVTEGFTLTADNLDVNSIFAQDITATGTIRGAQLVGASGEFTQGFDVYIKNSYGFTSVRAIGDVFELYTMSADGLNVASILGESSGYLDITATNELTINTYVLVNDIVEAKTFYSMHDNVVTSSGGMILATNGNLYMPWAGDWLSNVLGGKADLSGATFSIVYSNNWFRSHGQSGWYNESYGGGIWMADWEYLRTYGSKTFLIENFSMFGHLEMLYAGFNVIFRNDGTNFYILPGNTSGWTATTWWMDKSGRVFMNNGFLGRGSGYYMSLSNDNFFRCYDSALNMIDGVIRIGSPNYRVGQIYSTSASISTSDRNQKKNINELEDKHIQFIRKIVPVSFEFKNGTSGRTHIGFIAQDIEEAMNECDLTDLDFAGFCKDRKQIGRENEDGSCWYEDVLDEDGNVQYIYSLRYEEFIALNTKAIQYCMDRLDKIEELLGGNEDA